MDYLCFVCPQTCWCRGWEFRLDFEQPGWDLEPLFNHMGFSPRDEMIPPPLLACWDAICFGAVPDAGTLRIAANQVAVAHYVHHAMVPVPEQRDDLVFVIQESVPTLLEVLEFVRFKVGEPFGLDGASRPLAMEQLLAEIFADDPRGTWWRKLKTLEAYLRATGTAPFTVIDDFIESSSPALQEAMPDAELAGQRRWTCGQVTLMAEARIKRGPFPGLRALAREPRVPLSTLRDAINKSERLRQWRLDASAELARRWEQRLRATAGTDPAQAAMDAEAAELAKRHALENGTAEDRQRLNRPPPTADRAGVRGDPSRKNAHTRDAKKP